MPESYLPNEASFHPLDSVIEEGFQDVYVGSGLDNEEVGTYRRRYFPTYAFHYAFGPGGDRSSGSPIGYQLTKGWIFKTLHSNMRARIPKPKRPQLHAVSRESLTKYMENRSTIDEAVSDLSRWSTGRTRKKGQ